jgi:hypothetical protein
VRYAVTASGNGKKDNADTSGAASADEHGRAGGRRGARCDAEPDDDRKENRRDFDFRRFVDDTAGATLSSSKARLATDPDEPGLDKSSASDLSAARPRVEAAGAGDADRDRADAPGRHDEAEPAKIREDDRDLDCPEIEPALLVFAWVVPSASLSLSVAAMGGRGRGRTISCSAGIRSIRIVWTEDSPSVTVFSSSVTYFIALVGCFLSLAKLKDGGDGVTFLDWDT